MKVRFGVGLFLCSLGIGSFFGSIGVLDEAPGWFVSTAMIVGGALMAFGAMVLIPHIKGQGGRQ